MNNKELPAEKIKDVQAIEDLEKAAMAFQRIMEIAIKNTHPTDWFSFGGNAWLDTPGAERVARAIGLVVKDWTWKRDDYKDDEGAYFVIIAEGKVGHPHFDIWSDAIGVQWSRKPFFYKEGNRKKHLGEINPGNIIKDAYSDMVRNGVTRFLGLRGLPWNFLKTYGISEEKGRKVEFEAGKRGGKAKPAAGPPKEDPQASLEQITMVARTACKKVIGTDEESILETIPETLTLSGVNSLLKYIAGLPAEIEKEEWESKVGEVAA